MKRVQLTLICLATLLTVLACTSQNPKRTTSAQADVTPESLPPAVLATDKSEAAAPATQPALPKGHPDIAQLLAQKQQQQPASQLPAGHPDISKMRSPTGAPSPMSGQLPKGHPDISQMQRPASTQPAMIGTLVVQAVQGTQGGPAVGAAPVVVELYQKDQLLDKREGKLDEHGSATFENIPVGLVVQPVVRVTYKDIEFEAAGAEMDGTHSQQQVQVGVFEPTEANPAWQIGMQHVILQPDADGVQVMEMLAVENATDRAWIGKLGADNKRSTIEFPLPANAAKVQLVSGFHECCTKTEAGRVVNSMPLLPGVSQYRIAYTLPVNAGQAEFALTAAAPVKHLMVFVPDDGSTVVAEGVASSGTADMGGGKTRFYKATDLAAGAKVKLSISGITASAQTAAAGSADGPATSAAAGESGRMAKLVAGAGGLVIFVCGGMVLFLKAPKTKKAQGAA